MLGEDQSHTYEEQAVALTSGKISEAQKKKKNPILPGFSTDQGSSHLCLLSCSFIAIWQWYGLE